MEKKSVKKHLNQPKLIAEYDTNTPPKKKIKITKSENGSRMRMVRKDENGVLPIIDESVPKNNDGNTSPSTIRELLQKAKQMQGVLADHAHDSPSVSNTENEINDNEDSDNDDDGCSFARNVLLQTSESEDDTNAGQNNNGDKQDQEDDNHNDENDNQNDEDDADEELDETQKDAKVATNWIHEKSFDTEQEFQTFLKCEKCWSYRGSADCNDGKKILYRCNKIKRMSEIQCAAGIYVIVRTRYLLEEDIDADTGGNENPDGVNADGVNVYGVNGDGVNGDENKKEDDDAKMSKPQVSHTVKELIIEQYKNGRKAKKISFSLLDNPNIPREDKPSYNQVVKVINAYKKSDFGAEPITMRKLTEFISKYTDVPEDVDKSFILSFEKSPRNLPLIVAGVTDQNRKFHLSGLTITIAEHESTQDYALTFNAMKKGVRIVTGKQMQPEVLICDADPSIHNGFALAFGSGHNVASDTNGDKKEENVGDSDEQQKQPQYTIIMCYFHVLLNIQTKYKFANSNRNKADFKSDVSILHLCDSEKYWKDKSPFASETTISNEVMEKGKRLNQAFVYEEVKATGATHFYTFRSDIKRKITLHAVSRFENATYKSFDEFAKKAFDIWKITFPKEISRWKEAICTCPAFDTEYMCKHIVSIAYQLEIIDETLEEDDYDDEPLFVSKRGRPKHATKALLFD
ncbi:hypothetical protein Bhyg_11794 [Pseudolycoriella hygida]|uniref:SWIM-type domain-containing protein n=1 Tax=Pseudolycoriella hygida TaxID=35572 RepID=A0A9Q0MW97_9DIPT|nr:hypothetical protein Bhyg_11794 [Pseudolycoriella hygida]